MPWDRPTPIRDCATPKERLASHSRCRPQEKDYDLEDITESSEQRWIVATEPPNRRSIRSLFFIVVSGAPHAAHPRVVVATMPTQGDLIPPANEAAQRPIWHEGCGERHRPPKPGACAPRHPPSHTTRTLASCQNTDRVAARLKRSGRILQPWRATAFPRDPPSSRNPASPRKIRTCAPRGTAQGRSECGGG